MAVSIDNLDSATRKLVTTRFHLPTSFAEAANPVLLHGNQGGKMSPCAAMGKDVGVLAHFHSPKKKR